MNIDARGCLIMKEEALGVKTSVLSNGLWIKINKVSNTFLFKKE